MTNSSLFRPFLDSHRRKLLRELPNKFTAIQFAEIIQSLFPREYHEAIILFGSEHELKSWIPHYYFPNRSFVKRFEVIRPKGPYFDLSAKDPLKKIWCKV